jgi:hypothetical protein
MTSKNTTKTTQETMVLKYGYQWVETTETSTVNGITVKKITKKIERDPKVGFFRKLLRM